MKRKWLEVREGGGGGGVVWGKRESGLGKGKRGPDK